MAVNTCSIKFATKIYTNTVYNYCIGFQNTGSKYKYQNMIDVMHRIHGYIFLKLINNSLRKYKGN